MVSINGTKKEIRTVDDIISQLKESNSMNLYQKLVEVRKTVGYAKKEAQGYQYSYVQGSQLLAKIRPRMDELNIILSTNVKELTTFDAQLRDKKGTSFTQTMASMQIEYTWVDGDNPGEMLTSNLFMVEPIDDCKKIGSMLTYGERYFILKFFQVPTDSDDPDAFQQKIEGPEKSKLLRQAHKLMDAKKLKSLQKDKLLALGCDSDFSAENLEHFCNNFQAVYDQFSESITKKPGNISIPFDVPKGITLEEIMEFVHTGADYFKLEPEEYLQKCKDNVPEFWKKFEAWKKKK